MKIYKNQQGNLCVGFEFTQTEYTKDIVENPDPNTVLYAWREVLIGTLQRRIKACESIMAHHLGDSFLTQGDNVIAWKRNNGTYGYFNIPTWELMKDCLEHLKKRDISTIVENEMFIEQLIKAIMNDAEINRSFEAPSSWLGHNGKEVKIPFSMLTSALFELFSRAK